MKKDGDSYRRSREREDTTARMLSDDTIVAGTTWANMKEIAMKPKYYQSRSFLELAPVEQGIIDALIAAQTAQGDDLELQYQTFDSNDVDGAE